MRQAYRTRNSTSLVEIKENIVLGGTEVTGDEAVSPTHSSHHNRTDYDGNNSLLFARGKQYIV